jgi:hypothetical protein
MDIALDTTMNVIRINGLCYGIWDGLYVELNRAGGGSDVHLLHVTQTTLDPVTLAIVAFGFSALVVVEVP